MIRQCTEFQTLNFTRFTYSKGVTLTRPIFIANGVSVCLFVCLSARMSQNTHLHFMKFSICVICGRGWRQCNILCTSGVVNDVIFSRNRAKWPESNTTYVSSSSPGWRHRGRSLSSPTASCYRPTCTFTHIKTSTDVPAIFKLRNT